MGKIIDLSTFQGTRKIKNQPPELDLNQLLQRATLLQIDRVEIKGKIAVIDFTRLKRVFEAKLAGVILKTANVDAEFFLCGTYIAALLVEIGQNPPPSWYAIDYFIKAEKENKPFLLKKGGDVCFLIYAVFPERGDHRVMKRDDYQVIGRSLFYNYYNRTGQPIAYFMSQRFKTMADITQQCLRELKKEIK